MIAQRVVVTHGGTPSTSAVVVENVWANPTIMWFKVIQETIPIVHTLKVRAVSRVEVAIPGVVGA